MPVRTNAMDASAMVAIGLTVVLVASSVHGNNIRVTRERLPFPRLVPRGPVEIVWNQTADACPGLNQFGHIGEQPDSMPVAWHNPLTNMTSLISATDWGTFATVGASLQSLVKHDCSHRVYTSVNATDPSRFAAHQWLQSARVFPNGSGAALVHSEFHGDTISPHNSSLCSYNLTHPAPNGDCQLWSTSLAVTNDGGANWRMARDPPELSLVFAAPRRYYKEQPISGFGALGGMIDLDGYFYGHVQQSHVGPAPDSGPTGVCAFRTPDLFDPKAFRGWNGTAWSVTWVDPYTAPTGTLSVGHVCAVVDTGIAGNAHPNPRTFSGAWRPKGWPSHVMLGWPEGTANQVSYAFPAWQPGDDAAFTQWRSGGENLDITGWVPPSLGLTADRLMYPSLLDADSPFELGKGTPQGLSYTLLGNKSAYVYFVIGRKYIARIPVAWVAPDAPSPRPPFPPPPPNPRNCTADFNVSNAGRGDVNGMYKKTKRISSQGLSVYELDGTHQLYAMCGGPGKCRWTLAHMGVPSEVYYETEAIYGAEVPVSAWRQVYGSPPTPTVVCTHDGPLT